MPLSPTETRAKLTELGHLPRRSLGQNFLVDGNIVRKSLELADIKAGDQVVEIGPGLGTLTAALLEAGAEVWAIEMDPTLHSHIENSLSKVHSGRLHLMKGDAVDHPLAGYTPAALPHSKTEPFHPQTESSMALIGRPSRPRQPDDGSGIKRIGTGSPLPAAPTVEGINQRQASVSGDGGLTEPPRAETFPTLPPEPEPFKIVANLPYAITTPWLDGVLSGPLPERMVLMLQQEAAQRYLAQPGTKSFGAISIFLQSAYEIKAGHKVGPNCFHPRPDVDSMLLPLHRRPSPVIFPAAAKLLIRSCFQQRRKQIGALLREKAPDGGAAWLEQLRAAGLSPQARPEAIPVALWATLAPSAA